MLKLRLKLSPVSLKKDKTSSNHLCSFLPPTLVILILILRLGHHIQKISLVDFWTFCSNQLPATLSSMKQAKTPPLPQSVYTVSTGGCITQCTLSGGNGILGCIFHLAQTPHKLHSCLYFISHIIYLFCFCFYVKLFFYTFFST